MNRENRFAKLNISRLKQLKLSKGVIQAPFSSLKHYGERFVFTSWSDEHLPDTLWAALIITELGRERGLATFRHALNKLHELRNEIGDFCLTHTDLSKLDYVVFSAIFQNLSEDTKSSLVPLLLLDCLPDKEHWRLFLNGAPNDTDWSRLAFAIAKCFDHQSDEATDCRWLRLMSLFVLERIHVPGEMAEEIVHYPNRGDLRAVRPTIRATEAAFRMARAKVSDTPSWIDSFWSECMEKTACLPQFWKVENDINIDANVVVEEIIKIYDELIDHFFKTMSTTAVDAKHDGAFGLVLFSLQVCLFAAKGNYDRTIVGRMLLRTCVETFITLRFLASKDDPTIWLQYRNYGSGQNKLAFLKNFEQSEQTFIDIEELHRLANEDRWMEFLDIKLGSWSDKNLRKMAEESGAKDIYDKYYDALSGFVHGTWGAVRATCLTECANPLHRFHRVPVPPRADLKSVLVDICKLVNRCLDELTGLYPTFKPRLKSHHVK